MYSLTRGTVPADITGPIGGVVGQYCGLAEYEGGKAWGRGGDGFQSGGGSRRGLFTIFEGACRWAEGSGRSADENRPLGRVSSHGSGISKRTRRIEGLKEDQESMGLSSEGR